MILGPFALSDQPAVIDLWRRCGLVVPQNNPAQDIARKLLVDPGGFLVGRIDGRVVATCMVGYEGHRGWINYLAVRPDLQGRGLGRRIMQEAENLLKSRGCPKINLQIRATNTGVIRFYERLGFARDPVVSLGKRLDPDEPYPAA